MSADLYAVYDEETGTILHVECTLPSTAQSPEDIIATLGVAHDRLRVLKLPAEGLTRPARVVNGQLRTHLRTRRSPEPRSDSPSKHRKQHSVGHESSNARLTPDPLNRA